MMNWFGFVSLGFSKLRVYGEKIGRVRGGNFISYGTDDDGKCSGKNFFSTILFRRSIDSRIIFKIINFKLFFRSLNY